jgi:hypothetical protein
MLFDLRGGGRRRVVQGIYLTLAVLMGGGLILFGIGGNTSGGLLDAFNGSSGGGSNPFKAEVKTAQRRVTAQPKSPTAWAGLARVRFQSASAGDNFERSADGTGGQYTAKGKRELSLAGQAWDRYLALNPAHPDDNLASLMLQAFGPVGLNQPARAAQAAEVITEVRPDTSAFFQLAVYAYQAGQTRKGDLAALRAVSLAPKDQRDTLRTRLKDAKDAVAASSSGSGTTTTPGS